MSERAEPDLKDSELRNALVDGVFYLGTRPDLKHLNGLVRTDFGGGIYLSPRAWERYSGARGPREVVDRILEEIEGARKGITYIPGQMKFDFADERQGA